MADLKPCPFCGGKAQIRYTGNGSGPMGYTYICSKCGKMKQVYF